MIDIGYIKVAVSFLLVFCLPVTVSAENLISARVFQHSKEYDITHVFTDPGDLVFHITDPSVSGSWEFSVLTQDGSYEDRDINVSGWGYCIFSPSRMSWKNAQRIYDEVLTRNLYKLRVAYITDSGERSERFVMLGLAPNKPVISDVAFTYEYNWERDCIWPDGDFSFNVDCDGAIAYMLVFSDSFLFSLEDVFFRFVYRYEADCERIHYDADWGEFVRLWAYNDYGSIWSDTTLCTTDYITDEAILQRIGEIERQSGVGSAFGTERSRPIVKDGILYVPDSICRVSVYSMLGSTVMESTLEGTLDLNCLADGLYFIVCADRNNRRQTLKYRKN